LAKRKSKPRAHDQDAGLGPSPSRDGCRLNGRLWLEKDGETFIAWGRVTLLERIREHGSINAAAASMGMGYRHAWTLVEQMNRMSPKPLVEKSTGGSGGGGTVLTEEGETVIRNFWSLVDGFRRWMGDRDPRLWSSPENGA